MIGLNGTTTGYGANAAELAKLSIRLGNSTAPTTGIYSPGANQLAVSTGGTERVRIDSNGRLLVGTSTSVASKQLIFQNSAEDGLTIRVQANSYPNNWICLDRQLGGGSAVTTGASVGAIAFRGWDGSNAITAAYIYAQVDGTPGTNDMPGRLVFSTTADGASTPTERLRITSAGVLQVADAGDIAVGTTTGTKIGTATTQKIGFYNKTPVVQPAAVVDATDAASAITQLNALLARMRDLGLIAT